MINLIDFNKIVIKKKQNIIRVSSTDTKIKLKRCKIKLKHMLIQIFDS